MRPFAPLLLSSVLLLGGCATYREATIGEDANMLGGAGSIMARKSERLQTSDTEEFEIIHIDDLLKAYALDKPAEVALGNAEQQQRGIYLRNEAQARIVAASNQKCGSYIRRIVEKKARLKSNWTTLGLLFSGAASIVGHAATAKALAAGSTAATGIQSANDEAHFNNLTVNIIASGIKKRREVVASRIDAMRAKSLVEYPVNAAIADAIEYHGACNIVSGMETAAQATQVIDTSALAAAKATEK